MLEILLAVITAVSLKLAYERAKDVSVWLVRQSCRLLPSHIRAEMQERMEADLSYIEGDAWKIISAIGLTKAIVPIAFRRALRLGRLSQRSSRELVSLSEGEVFTIAAEPTSSLILRRTKRGNSYAFLQLADSDGKFEIVVFSGALREHGRFVEPKSVLKMIVRARNVGTTPMLELLSIEDVARTATAGKD